MPVISGQLVIRAHAVSVRRMWLRGLTRLLGAVLAMEVSKMDMEQLGELEKRLDAEL